MRHDILLQDLDLLNRLTHYVDTLEARVRDGTGWLIFRADDRRASHVERSIRHGLAVYRPLISSYLMPWRDFALNAFMDRELRQPIESTDDARIIDAFSIANQVAKSTQSWLADVDLLLLRGVAPAHRHELDYLERVIVWRYDHQRATLILTPKDPDGLAHDVRALDPDHDRWSDLFARLYERCLIAW